MSSSPFFESLRVWHEARRLTARVYEATRRREFAADAALRNQIRRAMVSVMSNIAEGYERGGRKEFLRFSELPRVPLPRCDLSSTRPRISAISILDWQLSCAAKYRS
jgi:23S rRNA-intervening sequence protein